MCLHIRHWDCSRQEPAPPQCQRCRYRTNPPDRSSWAATRFGADCPVEGTQECVLSTKSQRTRREKNPRAEIPVRSRTSQCIEQIQGIHHNSHAPSAAGCCLPAWCCWPLSLSAPKAAAAQDVAQLAHSRTAPTGDEAMPSASASAAPRHWHWHWPHTDRLIAAFNFQH